MLLLEISRGGSDGTWCDTAHIGAAQDIWYGMKHNHALVGCTLSSSTQLSGKKRRGDPRLPGMHSTYAIPRQTTGKPSKMACTKAQRFL